MKGIVKHFRSFLSDESGQGALEYILIIGLIVLAIFVLLLIFRDRLRQVVTKINNWMSGAGSATPSNQPTP